MYYNESGSPFSRKQQNTNLTGEQEIFLFQKHIKKGTILNI